MNPSFHARAASLVASILVTFGAVKAIADYAYPKAVDARMACTASCNHPSADREHTHGI